MTPPLLPLQNYPEFVAQVNFGANPTGLMMVQFQLLLTGNVNDHHLAMCYFITLTDCCLENLADRKCHTPAVI